MTEEEPLLSGKTKLNEGSYGIVYSGAYPDGRKAAVKRILKSYRTNGIAAYREIDMLSKVKDHPNFVQLLDVYYNSPFSEPFSPILDNGNHPVQRDDTLSIVMCCADYGDLISFTNQYKRPDYFQKVVADILLAIEFLHHQGIIHRDIKPNNILVSRTPYIRDSSNAQTAANAEIISVQQFRQSNETRRRLSNEEKYDDPPEAFVAMLCDLGNAKFHSQQITNTPDVFNVYYQCPESILDLNYDYKADCWNFGVILYRAVTGRAFVAPKKDWSPMQIMNLLLKQVVCYESEAEIRKLLNRAGSSFSEGIKIPDRTVNFKRSLGLSNSTIASYEHYTGASFDSLVELITGLLRFNPETRWTAERALNSPFFNKIRSYIQRIRSKYLKSIITNPIGIIDCKERSWVFEIVREIYESKERNPALSDRIIFHAIDIFDRYLSSLPKPHPDLLETDVRGRYFTLKETKYYFMFCVYISLKYFVNDYHGYSVSEIVFWNCPKSVISDTYRDLFYKFEEEIIEILGTGMIYQPTIYEMINLLPDRLTYNEMGRLYNAYRNLHNYNGKILKDVAMDIFTTYGIGRR
jgi:serine/threonine protein kinase